MDLLKTSTHGKNRHTVPERFTAKKGDCIIKVIKGLWFYRACGCLTQFSQKQVSEIPQSTQSKQTSPLKHPRPYIVHENTPILIVLINTLTSNTTEQISPKSPNLLKHLDRLPKHSKIYAEQQSFFPCVRTCADTSSISLTSTCLYLQLDTALLQICLLSTTARIENQCDTPSIRYI